MSKANQKMRAHLTKQTLINSCQRLSCKQLLCQSVCQHIIDHCTVFIALRTGINLVSKDSKTTVLKPVVDGPKDVSKMRLDELLETRVPTHTTQQYAANRSEFASPVTKQTVDSIQARREGN